MCENDDCAKQVLLAYIRGFEEKKKVLLPNAFELLVAASFFVDVIPDVSSARLTEVLAVKEGVAVKFQKYCKARNGMRRRS